MGKTEMNDDKGSLAIGGGVMMGIGVGFFFLRENTLAFIGCIIAGIGFGLMVSSIIPRGKKE